MKPLAIDLFCGYGGWAKGFSAAGYRVIGFDNEPKCRPKYEAAGGEFVLADVRTLDGVRLVAEYGRPRVMVSSSPCTEFSSMTIVSVARGQRPPQEPWGDKGIGLVHEALRVIYEAEPEFWCVENVRGAERFIGPPIARNGAQSLWGYFPGFIASPGRKRRHRDPRWTGTADYAQRRAIIPYPLSYALAEACLPEACVNGPTPVRTPAIVSAPEAVNAARPLTEGEG